MSLLTWVLIGLLVWLALLAVLVGLFVLSARRPRRNESLEFEVSQAERRTGADRRIGLPDTRPVRTERRQGPDRRGLAA